MADDGVDVALPRSTPALLRTTPSDPS
jgi:hypothetical protein